MRLAGLLSMCIVGHLVLKHISQSTCQGNVVEVGLPAGALHQLDQGLISCRRTAKGNAHHLHACRHERQKVRIVNCLWFPLHVLCTTGAAAESGQD